MLLPHAAAIWNEMVRGVLEVNVEVSDSAIR